MKLSYRNTLGPVNFQILKLSFLSNYSVKLKVCCNQTENQRYPELFELTKAKFKISLEIAQNYCEEFKQIFEWSNFEAKKRTDDYFQFQNC